MSLDVKKRVSWPGQTLRFDPIFFCVYSEKMATLLTTQKGPILRYWKQQQRTKRRIFICIYKHECISPVRSGEHSRTGRRLEIAPLHSPDINIWPPEEYVLPYENQSPEFSFSAKPKCSAIFYANEPRKNISFQFFDSELLGNERKGSLVDRSWTDGVSNKRNAFRYRQ
jgi:hypothetical protein